MGFLDKAKAAAEQAAAKTKEEYEEFQLKRELGQAYTDIGKATFELIESGELADAELDEHAAKIRALHGRAAAAKAPAEPEGSAESTEAEPEAVAPEPLDAPEKE